MQQLDDGIEAAVENAASLINEAKCLFSSGFHARAYTLSHIAREELAKVTMLYATGLRILAGNAVDWGKLHKRLRDHKSKLTNDALLLFVSTPGAADTLPLEHMLAGSQARNDWKNESLYIAFKEGTFRTPAKMITPRKAERTIALALFTLNDTKDFLSAGGKLVTRDAETAKKIFQSALNPEKLKAPEAMAVIKSLSRLLEQARSAGYRNRLINRGSDESGSK